jgi:CheY-like chemotaxis protein
MMPGGGGYALLDHVRRIEKPPPVLLVTGLVGDHIAEHLARRGAAACLLKPFSVRALLDAVNEITADSGVERSGEGVA